MVTFEPTLQEGGEVRLHLSGGTTGAPVREYIFPINPEDLVIEMPARATTTQTLGGAYVDHWGAGLSHVALRGHTGWRGHKGHDDGFRAFVALRDIYYDYLDRCGRGDPAAVVLDLALVVPQGFGYYRIVWDDFKASKSTAGGALLFRYELAMTIIEVHAGTGLGPAPAAPVPATALDGIAAAAPTLSDLHQALAQIAPAPTPLYAVPSGSAVAATARAIAQQVYGTAVLAQRLERANGLQLGATLPAGMLLKLPQEPV